jgi:hypothetical protein
MRREGGYLFVVTALIIGLSLGLLISLVISPVNYQNVPPSMLRPADKDLYRAMIALSFNARGDMGRAQARLDLLEDDNPQVGLAAQAQQSIAQGKPAEEARSLALLAAALGGSTGSPTGGSTNGNLGVEPVLTVPPSTPHTEPVEVLTPTLDIPVTRPTNPPLPPAPMPSPTPGEAYVLKDRTNNICDVEFSQILQVYVIDKAGKSVPGAEVIVSWSDGEDHFFTGMKPAIDVGYADFKMDVGVPYNVRMANGGQTSTNITAPNCKLDSGMEYKGGVKLIFGAP